MQRERDELRALVQTQRQTIQTQERELRRLRAALRAVTAEPTAQSIKTEDEDVPMDGGGPAPVPAPPNEAEIEEEAEDDDEDEDIEPVWGEDDAMYFCGICGWEIAEALCQNCCQRYDGYDVHLDPHGNPLPNSDNVFAERDEAYRLTTARGTTPLLDVDSGRLRPDTVAYGYEGRVNEYRALLSRGATRLMCETFYLSFSQETGIVLGMADDLFDDWAGEELEDAISWKVYLGREIHLEHGDDGGSEYIDAVLEDALLFGRYTESHVFWETVQTEPQHWVTRPTAEIKVPASASSDCSDSYVESTWPVHTHPEIDLSARLETLAHDDYLWDNSADEDEECDSADDEDGQVQLGWDSEGGWGPDGPRESDSDDAMDEDTTAADGENAGDDEDDEEEDEDEDEDEDETIISEPDSFDSDFDSDEELSGDEPILAGNQEYFKSSYVPRSGPDPTHYC